MTIKDDLLRAAAYIGATNDSPDDEASISAVEGDRIAGVLRELAGSHSVAAAVSLDLHNRIVQRLEWLIHDQPISVQEFAADVRELLRIAGVKGPDHG